MLPERNTVKFINANHEIEGDEPHWYQAARTIDRGDIGAISFVDEHLIVTTTDGEIHAYSGDCIARDPETGSISVENKHAA